MSRRHHTSSSTPHLKTCIQITHSSILPIRSHHELQHPTSQPSIHTLCVLAQAAATAEGTGTGRVHCQASTATAQEGVAAAAVHAMVPSVCTRNVLPCRCIIQTGGDGVGWSFLHRYVGKEQGTKLSQSRVLSQKEIDQIELGGAEP